MHALGGPARRDKLDGNRLLMLAIPHDRCLVCAYLQLSLSVLLHIARDSRGMTLCCHPPSWGQGGTEGSFGVYLLLGISCRRNLDWEWSHGSNEWSWAEEDDKPLRYTLCEGTEAQCTPTWMVYEAAAELV